MLHAMTCVILSFSRFGGSNQPHEITFRGRRKSPPSHFNQEERQALFEKFIKKKQSEGYMEKVLWVLNEDGTIKPIPAVLGLSDGDSVEIFRSDLKEGAKIIIKVLKDGEVFKADKGESGISFRDLRRTSRRMGRGR